jgi:hypothetical protein
MLALVSTGSSVQTIGGGLCVEVGALYEFTQQTTNVTLSATQVVASFNTACASVGELSRVGWSWVSVAGGGVDVPCPGIVGPTHWPAPPPCLSPSPPPPPPPSQQAVEALLCSSAATTATPTPLCAQRTWTTLPQTTTWPRTAVRAMAPLDTMFVSVWHHPPKYQFFYF